MRRQRGGRRPPGRGDNAATATTSGAARPAAPAGRLRGPRPGTAPRRTPVRPGSPACAPAAWLCVPGLGGRSAAGVLPTAAPTSRRPTRPMAMTGRRACSGNCTPDTSCTPRTGSRRPRPVKVSPSFLAAVPARARPHRRRRHDFAGFRQEAGTVGTPHWPPSGTVSSTTPPPYLQPGFPPYPLPFRSDQPVLRPHRVSIRSHSAAHCAMRHRSSPRRAPQVKPSTAPPVPAPASRPPKAAWS